MYSYRIQLVGIRAEMDYTFVSVFLVPGIAQQLILEYCRSYPRLAWRLQLYRVLLFLLRALSISFAIGRFLFARIQ